MSWKDVVRSQTLSTEGTQPTEAPELDTSVGIVTSVPRGEVQNPSGYDVRRWRRFMMMCTSQGVKEAEVSTMFTELDKVDLLEEPEHKLPLHAKTIVNAIRRNQQAAYFDRFAVQTACNSEDSEPVVQTEPVHRTCGLCRHFQRIEHPHLGKCMAGEPTGACGNWDIDNRDYCHRFEVVP